MTRWFQVAVAVPSALSDLLSAHLFDLGCCGLQEEDLADRVRLIAYFDDAADRDAVRKSAQEYLVAHGISIEVWIADVPDEDWTTAWRAYFKPIFPTPRIGVCPPWNRPPAPPEGFVIEIDPKMAFGTGHHETTRLALQALDRHLRPGDCVLDVGTGSGILSIAAVKLGAVSVAAVDTDPPAIDNARENFAQNGVSAAVRAHLGSVDTVVGVFDMVVANIISSILVPLLPDLAARVKPHGCAVLGGILTREKARFLDATNRAGLVVHDILEEGEWVCVVAKKPTLDLA